MHNSCVTWIILGANVVRIWGVWGVTTRININGTIHFQIVG